MDARTAPARCRTAAVILAGWAAGWLVLSQSALAQSPPTPIQVGGWTVNGSIRLRFEDWDLFKAQTGDNAYGYGASLLRVCAGRQFHSQDWLFELCQPTLIGLPSNAIAPAPQGQLGFGGTYFAANPDRKAGAFLKQAFVRFKGIGGDQLSNLRIGRFEYADGLELPPEGPLGALVRDRVANRLIGNLVLLTSDDRTCISGQGHEGAEHRNRLRRMDQNHSRARQWRGASLLDLLSRRSRRAETGIQTMDSFPNGGDANLVYIELLRRF